jgi:uncharacterized protein (TIGR02001 family)
VAFRGVGVTGREQAVELQPTEGVKKKGLAMKKFVLSAVAALVVSSAPALAADLRMATKAPPAPAFSPWDIAFGAGIASDYNFRGISQSANKPSVNAYFEGRYNSTKDLQWYASIGGYSIDFPNRASAEIDLNAGVRPTFGPLALDFGVQYYWYPGGQCFFAGAPAFGSAGAECGTVTVPNALPNGNYAKKDWSFLEFYAKGVYTFNDNFNMGAGVFYTEDWLNTGADGTYANVTAKFIGQALPNGWGWYLSGEYGHYWLGTTDGFYGTPAFPLGVPLPDYSTWNIGLGLTYKVFTLDFRYYDTDLNKGECNVLTADHTAYGGGPASAINPLGLNSKWCSPTFIGKLSFDLTLNSNVK